MFDFKIVAGEFVVFVGLPPLVWKLGLIQTFAGATAPEFLISVMRVRRRSRSASRYSLTVSCRLEFVQTRIQADFLVDRAIYRQEISPLR
jgi:hypothetical protein